MAKKKTVVKKTDVEQLSSAELYKLAQKVEQEEQQKLLEENREKIRALRNQRRKLATEFNKAIKKIDAKIDQLSGKKTVAKASRGSITEAVISIIGKAGEISSRDLKYALEKRSLPTNNLSQTLGYLKRQKRIVSPSRAMYKLP